MSKQPDQNKVMFPRGVDFIDLPLHADDRGQLTVAEDRSLPFEARRVFWLTGVPEAAERGGHAHSTCAEVLYAVSGAVKIDLSDGTRDLTVELSLPNRGIVIPPMVWCRLYDFSPNFVGLCFASETYRPEGYFRSWEEFRKNAI
ncbi:MAG: FdtA/QdtA family cupin domain-containing protein [Prevotellaceae bacterium]|nr:FdtA/QdtA family cupin domain-containing protein [Prevotellaceae bacterium]